MKNFRFEMTKVYSWIPPPPNEKLQIWDDQSLLQNSPPNEKLQIWDDQSLLWNTPPPQKMKNFRFEMTKVYSGITPPPENEKLQIWDDQSLLRNTPLPPRKAWNPGDRMWRLICIPRVRMPIGLPCRRVHAKGTFCANSMKREIMF